MSGPLVHSARSLDDALAVLAAHGPTVTVLAGGTDLMVELRTGRRQVERVLDLWQVDELRGLRHEAGGLRIGALTTVAELLRAEVAAGWPLLPAVARCFAAEQIRSRATVGGNLGTASPAGDLPPALMVYDAQVRLCARGGVRELPLHEFLIGYRKTARRGDELIASLWLPARPDGERAAFRKVGTRTAQSIAKLAVAVAARGEAGVVAAVRGAAGAVAERTVALPSLRALVGQPPAPARLLAASRAAARHDCAPIDDVRSTARYRRHALQRVLAGLLGEVLQVTEPEEE